MATTYQDHVADEEALPEEFRDDFYSRMKHTVVMIQSLVHGTKEYMHGGGFGVEDGFILTAFHVIGKNAENVEYMCYNDIMFHPAEVVHTDSSQDLALLRPTILSKTEAEDGIPLIAMKYVNFCPTELMRVGMQVISISHPSGLIYSCTFGEIAYPANDVNYGRKMGAFRTREDRDLIDIQADMDVVQINNVHGAHGSSGCPMFNGAGLVVGMTIIIKGGFDFIVHPSLLVAFIAAADRGKTKSSIGGSTMKQQKIDNKGKGKGTLVSLTKRYSENAKATFSQIKYGLPSLHHEKADPARELEDTAISIDRSDSQNTSTKKPQNSIGNSQKVEGNPSEGIHGNTVPTESTKRHHDPDNACAANCSKHYACQSKYFGHKQNSYPKVPSSPLHRGSALLKSTHLNEKANTAALQLKRPRKINSQSTLAPTPKQLNSADREKTKPMNMCACYDNRKAKQSAATKAENQMLRDKSSAKDTFVITGSEEIVKSVPSYIPGQATVISTINNVFRTPFSATATKKSLQYTSVERQVRSLEDWKMHDIGSLQLSRIPESKIDISNFTMQKERKPVPSLQRKLEVTLNTVSKPSNCAMRKKYALSSPSLKSMILEESKTDRERFNPLKCVMESTKRGGLLQVAPAINKKLEVSPKDDNNLVLGTGNPDAYQGNVSMDTSAYKSCENLADLELPVLIENDRNVEKAEACARELKDICNMPRKKNEEAKMYDEKIRTLQKKFTSLNLSQHCLVSSVLEPTLDGISA